MVVVSGFLPVPLPMMIPFMGAQSLVIGKMFGEGFQYGKRKISAMSNDDFNKLTFEDMMSNARSEMKASIPTMQAALSDMQPLVETVVKEFFKYISIIGKMLPEQIRQVTGGSVDVGGKTLTEQFGLSQAEIDQLEAIGLQTADAELASKVAIPLTGDERREAYLNIKDTSGQTIREHLAILAAEKERLRLAKVLRPRAIRKFEKVAGAPVSVPIGVRSGVKKVAGQSQKLYRMKLVKSIFELSKQIKGDVGGQNYAVYIKRMTGMQQQLVNLLARYRF